MVNENVCIRRWKANFLSTDRPIPVQLKRPLWIIVVVGLRSKVCAHLPVNCGTIPRRKKRKTGERVSSIYCVRDSLSPNGSHARRLMAGRKISPEESKILHGSPSVHFFFHRSVPFTCNFLLIEDVARWKHLCITNRLIVQSSLSFLASCTFYGVL